MPAQPSDMFRRMRRHGTGFISTLGLELAHTERMLATDAARDWGNMRASLRTLALTLLVSALMGAAAWAFLTSLDIVTDAREHHIWLFALLPLVSVATAWIYRNHGLRAARGNNLVIDSSVTGTPIRARMAVLTFVCSVATHLAGGSAGREGTAVQIGGTIASNVAGIFHLDGRERQDLMLAGISAAFGGVFGTPLAGAFFGMEMCTIGKLNYSAEFDGERKDTCVYFYYGASDFYNTDSLLTSTTTGNYPQYALNLTSQQTEDREGYATDKIYIEGGGGLKPVVRAEHLIELAQQAIASKGADPEQVVINKASLVFPFEFPADYLDMTYWPQILSPTCKLVTEDEENGEKVATFMGLTDSSSSDENQGDVNRSILNYAPDITYHMQELLKIDRDDLENARTQNLLRGEYDVWLLIMANEQITTTTSGNQDLSDMYNYLAYQSYYNSMYGGGYYGYGYGGYGSYYSNYYNYSMMAAYAASSSTSTSNVVMLDKDRFYKAELNGPESATGRVPVLELTFAVPNGE